MPNFKYKSCTQKGEIITGTFSANAEEEVIAMIRHNYQYPMSIEPESQLLETINYKRKTSSKDLSIFCKQFHAMLRAGVPIVRALDIMRVQITQKSLREALEKVFIYVQTGESLSSALSRHQDVFPGFMVNMIASGEVTGNLDVVMNALANHYEKENRITNKIKSAMVYPMVLGVVTVVVVIILLTTVMPTFSKMFSESGKALPVFTQVLLNVSDFLIQQWLTLICSIVIAIILGKFLLRQEIIQYNIDKLKFHIPILKDVTVKIITSRLARTLSTLLASGIPLMTSLEVVAKIIGNKVIEKGLIDSIDDIREGTQLSTIIRKMERFPPLLDFMMRIGEESGTMDDVLSKTADIFDEEVDAAITRMTGLVEPLLIVLMALIVGSIVIAVALPMFGIAETIV